MFEAQSPGDYVARIYFEPSRADDGATLPQPVVTALEQITIAVIAKVISTSPP